MEITFEPLDEEGYPTEQCLDFIRKFDVFSHGFMPLVEFVESVWAYKKWGFILEGEALELHTAGWSGNEDIVRALSDNIPFWSICWQVHRKGGHYEFKIKNTL